MICLWTGKKCVTPFDFKLFKRTSSRPPRSPTDTCWPRYGHWSFLETEYHWWTSQYDLFSDKYGCGMRLERQGLAKWHIRIPDLSSTERQGHSQLVKRSKMNVCSDHTCWSVKSTETTSGFASQCGSTRRTFPLPFDKSSPSTVKPVPPSSPPSPSARIDDFYVTTQIFIIFQQTKGFSQKP